MSFEIFKSVTFETPFGPLKDEDELEMASQLSLFFYDFVADGDSRDYEKARKLYSRPIDFYKGKGQEPSKKKPRDDAATNEEVQFEA